MTAGSGRQGRLAKLIDRYTERRVLDRLAEAVRAGHSQALVVRGSSGVGKTVLLDYLAWRTLNSGCRVIRATGIQSEMELAFAGLHQLCGGILNHTERIPAPQHDALRTVFGVTTGPTPDRFVIGLGVLSLLSEAAAERPLICLVDDEQWLDRASVQTLGFVARRLAADPVGIVFAGRGPARELNGLPVLEVEGLNEEAAQALLDSALTSPLDDRVRDRVIAETQGNPLALLELPRGFTPAELAGGFGLPGSGPLTSRIEGSFIRQLAALPAQTQRLLLLAAAEPSGDQALVWRAAGRLGLPMSAAGPATETGMAEFGVLVRFRHPLARSAAYRMASPPERQEAHAALAEATDPAVDPDRRAWHRAQAAPGPDENVAVVLENSAGRAQARGGLAAAAAFLDRAVLLTADPARHTERALAAAQVSMQAGAFGKAQELLAKAEGQRVEGLDEFTSARVDLLHGQIAFASGLASDAASLLLKAAGRLEPHDLGLARETYLSAWMAARYAGHLAGADHMLAVSRAARATLPPSGVPRTVDLLLDGLTLRVTEGPAAAAPILRRAVKGFTSSDIPAEEALRWGWMAMPAAHALWDDDASHTLLARQVQVARDAGALHELPVMLIALAASVARSGDFGAASALIVESDIICEATGNRAVPFATIMLAALRGRHSEAVSLVEATIVEAEASGQGSAAAYADLASAIMYNGLGRYEEAFAAAWRASEDTYSLNISMWALPELAEAAARSGNAKVAAEAVARLSAFTEAAGTNFGLGMQARSHALLGDPEVTDELYRKAVDNLGRTRMRPELARAHLLYGEWLRRENRRVDAREQLRIAYGMLDAIGMEAFAERARHELQATGGTVRKRVVQGPDMLTAQERYIAQLARDGRTNPEIGAQLFLSVRTVEWHLRKVFTKLGISSRRELHGVLSKVTIAQSDSR